MEPFLIDSYLTDKIDIVSLAYDEWGVPTESVQTDVAARIEDKNELIKDREGKEVKSNTFIILSPDAIIDYDSKIIIREKSGETYTFDLKMAIVKLSRAHNFGLTHWEVWL